MEKFAALIVTGKLEVFLSEEKMLLEEVKLIQKYIVDEDIPDLAISLGKLSARTHNDKNVCNCIEQLIKYGSGFKSEEMVKVEDKRKICLEMLDLSVQSYKCLKRWADVNFIEEILEFDAKELLRVRQLGWKRVREIIDKMKEFGFNDWADKVSNELTVIENEKERRRKANSI